MTEMWDIAIWLVGYGFCTFVSLEPGGTFGGRSSLSNARGLGGRGLEMWRSVRNNSPPGLANFLSGDVAVTGYSMGGAAALYMAIQARASDNIKFVAPIHPMVRVANYYYCFEAYYSFTCL